MATLREIFPSLPPQPADAWDIQLSTPTLLAEFCIGAVSELEREQQRDALESRANAVILDIRAAALSKRLYPELTNYLLLLAHFFPMRRSHRDGYWEGMRLWLERALREAEQVSLTYLMGLAASVFPSRRVGQAAVDLVLYYCADILAFSRATSSAVELAKGAWRLAGLAQVAAVNIRVEVLIQCLAWSAPRTSADEELAARLPTDLGALLALRLRSEVSREHKKQILIFLSTAATLSSGRTTSEWARDALNEYSDDLRGFERLQLLIESLRGAQISEVRREWPKFAAAFADYQREFSGDVFDAYTAARFYRTVSPFLALTLPRGATDLAVAFLCEVRSVEPDRRRMGPDVVFAYNLHGGVVYSANTFSVFDVNEVRPVEFANTLNSILGMALAVDGDGRALEPPIRGFGVPSIADSPRFERVLRRALFGEAVVAAFAQEFRSCRALVDSSNLPIPWQALMLRALDFALPLARSLEEPAQDRPVHRVAYWSAGRGGGFTSILERQMLEGFFGANLSQFSGNQDDFLRMYQSSEFDLIWIDTHGEYDQFNPHRAGLVVAEGAVVQLGQLIGRAPTQVVGRRLLVLNACDSAASGPIGAPGGLGLASSLASAKQAVVAHFCPVDQRIALVSGTDRRHP